MRQSGMKANDFIGSYLEGINCQIYKGNVRLFANYEHTPINHNLITVIQKGEDLIQTDAKVQLTHTELIEYGYHIIKGTDKRYKIAKVNKGIPLKDTTAIKIILNIKEQIVWIEGPNTEKVKISVKRPGAKPRELRTKLQLGLDEDLSHLAYNQKIKAKWLRPEYDKLWYEFKQQLKVIEGEKKRAKPKEITSDVPFMISVNNELVCLEENPPDPYKILLLGDTGSGKSLTMMRILSQAFWKWKKDWWLLVDPLSQFEGCYEGMKHKPFLKVIERLGESPIGLPRNYFYMASKDVPTDIDKKTEHILALDTYEFWNKYKFITYGVQRWQLGGAERYIHKVIGEFGHCKSKEDVSKVLTKAFPPGKKDTLKSMKEKWLETFDSIYGFKFLNVFYNEPLTWRTTRPDFEYEGYPLIASMAAKLFTILNIDYGKRIPEDNQACSRNMLANIFQKFLQYKRRNPEAKKQRIWLCIDELNDIYKGVRGDDNLTKTTTEIFTQGRFQNFSFMATKQGFVDLPTDLIQNATTMIFGQVGSSSQDRMRIGKAFNLRKDQYRQLQELRKTKREIIAVQKEPFVVYDKDGNKKEGNTFYRGFLIPPNCNTKKIG